MVPTCGFVFLVLSMVLIVDATTGNFDTDWAGDWKATRRVGATDTVSIMFIFRRSQAQLQQLDAVRISSWRLILKYSSHSHASTPRLPLVHEKMTATDFLGGI